MKKGYILLIVLGIVCLVCNVAFGTTNATQNISLESLSVVLLDPDDGAIVDSETYLIGGELALSGGVSASNLKITGFLSTGEKLFHRNVPHSYGAIKGDYCLFGTSQFVCVFSTSDNPDLGSTSLVVIKFYVNGGYVGGTSPAISLANPRDGHDAVSNMLIAATGGDSGQMINSDTDGDGILDLSDNFDTVSNPDHDDPIIISDDDTSEDDSDNSIDNDGDGKCDTALLDQIAITPTKNVLDDVSKFGVDITLPEGSVIKKSTAGKYAVKEIGDYKALSFTCSEKVADVTKADVGIWGDNASKKTFSCAITGSIKGDEKLALSFDLENTDADGNSIPCTAEFTAAKAISMSNSVIGTGETPAEGRAGGDCSLVSQASSGGLGWIIDLLVLGLPVAMYGIRRRR